MMQIHKHWAAVLDDYVIALAWSPDSAQLAAASAAGPLHLFTTTDGTRLDLGSHDDGANCLAYAPTPDLLASGGQDGLVKFWRPSDATLLATAPLGPAWVEHLAWRPAACGGISNLKSQISNPPLLAAAAGRHLHLLHPDGTPAFAAPPAPKSLSALAWHPAGAAVAAAGFGHVRLWDADDHLLQKDYPYENGIHALVWSPDGRWLVSGNQNPSVHLWLVEEDQEFHMSGYESKVKDLAFSPDSRWLATGGGSEVCLWDCAGPGPEGREPLMLPHEAKLCALAFHPTSPLLAAASEDGVLQLWSPDRPQPLRAKINLPAPASQLAWSPDARHLAVGTRKGAIYVLRVEA